MGKRPKKNRRSETEISNLVVVVVAENLAEAADYEQLLKSNEIPVVVREQAGEVYGDGRIAIMVPEEHLDEAHAIIHSQEAFDDFYDCGLDDEMSEEFDSDVFDNEF